MMGFSLVWTLNEIQHYTDNKERLVRRRFYLKYSLYSGCCNFILLLHILLSFIILFFVIILIVFIFLIVTDD